MSASAVVIHYEEALYQVYGPLPFFTCMPSCICVDILIFRLDALALSVIATATWLAGWVAGWLAVTLRYCIKMAKPIGKLFRPSESPIILVF